jgi:hypothetical protein
MRAMNGKNDSDFGAGLSSSGHEGRGDRLLLDRRLANDPCHGSLHFVPKKALTLRCIA